MNKKLGWPWILLAVVVSLSVALGGWYLERWFNFHYGYGDKVKDTVKEMVKPECLKSP